MQMRRGMIRVLVLVVLAYAGVCAFLFASQDALLYHPTGEVERSDAEVLELMHEDVTLKVWKVGEGSDALLYFGGNAENVAGNIPRFAGLLPDTAVYLLNYRGYGGSDGEPDEQAFFRDAAFLYDTLARRHMRVSVIGRSLGSGVAAWLAAHRAVERLVLVTPFDSVEDVAQANYPIVPVSLLLRDKYRSVDRVPNIEAPVMVLIADRDRIVPYRHSMALVSRFPPSQVRVRTIANTTHNSIARSAAYRQALAEFLRLPPAEPEVAS